VNYRCPRVVIERSLRLVEHNRERFAKVVRPAPEAPGRIVLAGDGSDESVRLGRVLERFPDDGSTRAILARTNRELLPAVAAALERRLPFRPPGIELLVTSPLVDRALDEAESSTDAGLPVLARLELVRRRWAGARPRDDEDPDAPGPAEIAAALVGWAVRFPDLAAFRAAIADRREAIAALCRDDAPLTLATAHGTKGLEFDHVAVIGLDAGRFPSRRSVAESSDPDRALQEERRLAYVAWTRARRSLTLVYEPAAPSPFLLEAFDADELGLEPGTDVAENPETRR
jgi:superfamily I DNA/RNA helicase